MSNLLILLIDNITIRNFLTFRPITLELGKYNLFIGKNGSGKSILLKRLVGVIPHDPNDDLIIVQNTKETNLKNLSRISDMKYVSENRPSTNFSHINLDIGRNHPIEDTSRPLETIWRDDKFREQINKFTQNIFDRKIIDTKTPQEGVGIFYKKNNIDIPPSLDGFGIINSMKVLQVLLTSNESIVALEEPTIGFNPSITSKFLEYLVKNAPDDKQFIFTSQDFVLIIEFIKLFKTRDDFKIFKFEENRNQITITEVTELESIATDMSDSFPTKEDIELISKIFLK